MSRLKTLSILTGFIAALAISATPASAWFQSNTGQSQGKVKVLASGAFFYEAGSTNKVECPEKEVIKAQWQIQTKGQIKNQGQEIEEKQKPTTLGPHQQIQVKNWGKCIALIGTSKLEVTFSECNFQLQQPLKSKAAQKFTGATTKIPCVMKTGGICTVQIPVGMETQPGSGEGINVGLKEVEGENNANGQNQIDKVKATEGGINQGTAKGIYATASGQPLCTLPAKSESGELVGLEFEAEGEKLV